MGLIVLVKIYLQFNTQLEMVVLPNAVRTFNGSIITHLK